MFTYKLKHDNLEITTLTKITSRYRQFPKELKLRCNNDKQRSRWISLQKAEKLFSQ